MADKIISLVTSLTFLLLAFFLLWATWSTEKAFLLLTEYRLTLTLGALFLLFLSLLNFQREGKGLPTYTFNLLKGKGTVSIETLKKGIQTFVRAENPSLHVISCKLKEGGKLLELILAGQTEPSILENLSNLLAEQFGFEGQLDIFFEKHL